jgi:hypothetical protein
MSSVPISYDASDILKVSVAFNYERYIPGKITSKSKVAGTSNNMGSTPTPNTQGRIVNRGGTKIPEGNFKANQ